MRNHVRKYFVYIMASHTRILYVGVTNDLVRRVFGHRTKQAPGFASRYNVTRLVYFEVAVDVRSAIAREKQMKSWRREKKLALIETGNPAWLDLGEAWY